MMRACLLVLLCLGAVACAREGDTPGNASADLRIVPREVYAGQELHAAGLRLTASLDATASPQAADGSSLRWLINGHVVGSGVELPAQGFHRGDVVELQRVHSVADGAVQVVARDQVVVRNSPPQVVSVLLSRSRENGIYLQCEATSLDVDDDPVRLRYEWTVDGEPLVGALDELASLHDVAKGSQVRVRVFASDGQLESRPFESEAYRVDNLPPRLEVDADPILQDAADGRRIVIIQLHADDPDGDAVDIEFEGAPAGARYDATHGTVSWSVRGPIPSMRLVLCARDAKGVSVERILRLPGEEVARR